MKIGGVEVKGPAEEVLVLPRLEGENIAIRARAVLDMDEFEALCPAPTPPGIRTKDGWKPNDKDETYKQRVAQHGELRFAYMVLRSLEPSEIEWEVVNINDPSTWTKWQDELKEAGISSTEINRIIVCVMQANALDEAKLKEAREVFLHGPVQEPNEYYGPDTELENTQSGDPVSESESDRPE
jgi:hypothetical protein